MMLSLSVRQISFLLFATFLLMLLSYSPKSFAEDPIGQMIWVKGTVTATKPGQAARTLERRSAIFEHDTIDTTSGSTGEVGFTDTSVVTLREATQFKVDAYHYSKDTASGNKSVMSLVKGGLRTITGFIPKQNPDSYEMKTPVATIGVRGTQYSVAINHDGLFVKIDQGLIVAHNAAGSIDLQHCDDAVRCKLYAVIANNHTAPQALAKMPPIFNNEPPISAHSTLGAPIMPGNNGGGPAKTVKNFCVGLLQDIYHYTLGHFFD